MEFNPKIEEKRWTLDKEESLAETWQKETWWKFNENADKVYVIDTPPPYPAPVWHIGAVISYSMHDIIARIRRMQGYSVLYPIGIDRNGIPIEMYVEKYEHINMWETPREEFEKLCKNYLDKWTSTMIKIMKRIGLSGDFTYHYYETDSPQYRAITQRSFAFLWKKGLIYEDERPNNWCPHCKTTIADAEVEYKDAQGNIYSIVFKVKETGEDLIIATTRPELVGACQLVIVHPDDDRYKHLHGKHAIVPLYNREVEIKPHKEADPEFGSGAVMICSYGDFTDVRIFREENLQPIKLITQENVMSELAGKYKGLTPLEARKEIVKDLKELGLLKDEKPLSQKIPVHDKCGTRVEIIAMKEFYLKQLPFIDVLRSYANEIRWYPEKYKTNLKNWLDSISMDWPISRRRYYGTELPIWKCKNCGYIYVYEGDNYVKPWKESLNKKCPKCSTNDWEGEWRTFDTWMDSSITILYITKWLRDETFFKNVFEKGIKLRPQGYDIIRTWLHYSLLRVEQLLNKRAFDEVFINGMGLDEKGRKMSKSKGNIIDPLYLIEKYGADAIRLWIGMECSIGENYNISEEKINGAKKFLVKLWNIARFISSFPQPEQLDEEKLQPADRWILSQMEILRKKVISFYNELDFHKATIELRSFVWNVFAAHYIELVKKRARMQGFSEEEAKAAWYTLHKTLKTILILFSPIIPFITDAIWRILYGEQSIHKEKLPDVLVQEIKHEDLTEELMKFNSLVWNKKKQANMKFADPITIEIPSSLKVFEKDLIALHNIKV